VHGLSTPHLGHTEAPASNSASTDYRAHTRAPSSL
jgi:hypothetical protein